MMTRDTDVLVAGAGIAGLALATALAREGISATVLDAGPGIRPAPRGLVLQPNGLRVLAGLGVLELLQAGGAQTIRAVRFHRSGGRLLVAADYALLDPPWNYGLVCLPHQVQEALWARLAPGPVRCTVRWQARVEALERTRAGWEVRAQSPEGVERWRARVVVAADGARSRVRSLLGIRARVRPYRDAYALTVLPRPAGFPGELWQFQGGGALLGLAPVAPDWLYLYWYVPASRLERFRGRDLPGLQGAIGRVAPDLAGALSLPPGERWLTIAPLRVDAETWVVDGGALLGDAAHALNPNTAQGANQALEDAAVLAPVLAAALRRGGTDAASLAPYERARRPMATWMQRRGDESARLWTSRNPWMDWLQARATERLGRHPELLRQVVAGAAGLAMRDLSLADRLRLLI